MSAEADDASSSASPDIWPPCAQVAAGAHHSLLLTQRGLVLSCGKGYMGALGQASRVDQPSPRLVAGLAHLRIVRIAAGQSHSAFVCEDGALYTCGAGTNGRLGLDHAYIDAYRGLRTPAPNVPQRVPIKMRIRWVACGTDHTIAIAADGTALAFGRGQAGQLGTGNRRDQPTPVAISGIRSWTSGAQREAGRVTPEGGEVRHGDGGCDEGHQE